MSKTWHPFYQAQVDGPTITIKKAAGVVLTDVNDREYIDVNSSWWVNVHGHGREEIKNAIAAQFDKIDHVIFSGFTHEPAEKLSAAVVELLGPPFNKVFYSDNGSTAVEVALKMAIQFYSNQNQKRTKIVALEGAYHGDTFGAMAMGQRGYFNAPFEPFFFDVEFLPFPSAENLADCLQKAHELAQKEDVIAFIAEPLVQGSAGMLMYAPEVLDKLTAIFKSNGSLVIFDEIMTGWGRLGTLFAMEQCQNKPDIVCLSKGLTGGVMPLGLTVATQAIYDVFDSNDKMKALLHGHSFTGNPLSCSAALASISLFKTQEIRDNMERVCKKMREFEAKLQEIDNFYNVRVSGTILAVDLYPATGYFSDMRNKIYYYFLDRGILCRPLGSTVFFNPPYVISDEQLDYCFDVLIDFHKE
jgi:adenosylmethionine-8-amino-7-oxononanoate aminotransferase